MANPSSNWPIVVASLAWSRNIRVAAENEFQTVMPPRKSCDVPESEARRQSGRRRSVASYAEGGDTEQEAQDTVGGGRKRKLEEADQPARRASRASASGAAGTQVGPGHEACSCRWRGPFMSMADGSMFIVDC
jgi:hypothetical protein